MARPAPLVFAARLALVAHITGDARRHFGCGRSAALRLALGLAWALGLTLLSPSPAWATPGGEAPEGDPLTHRPGLLDGPEGPRAQVVLELPWNEARVERIPGARLQPRQDGQAFDALEIVHRDPSPLTLTLLRIPSPKLRHRRYALMGRVRTEDVAGAGYLEMWSHFPEKGRFFSRTLAPDGPLRSLAGTQAWRRFALPFDAHKAPSPPLVLELKLVLPGPGRVWLGSLRLVEVPDEPLPAGAAPPARDSGRPPPSVPPWKEGALWWSPDTGWTLGVLGSIALGSLALGLLLLGSRIRRAAGWRPLVTTLGVLGAGALTLGVVAHWQEQPAEVSLPLAILGGLAWLVAALVVWILGRSIARSR